MNFPPSSWLPTTSSFLKKAELLFLAQFICFSSAQIECYALTIILSELNCILLSGRFSSALVETAAFSFDDCY